VYTLSYRQQYHCQQRRQFNLSVQLSWRVRDRQCLRQDNYRAVVFTISARQLTDIDFHFRASGTFMKRRETVTACNNLNEKQSHQLWENWYQHSSASDLHVPTSKVHPKTFLPGNPRNAAARDRSEFDVDVIFKDYCEKQKVRATRTQIYIRFPFAPQRMRTNHAITHNNGDDNKHTFDYGTSFPFKGPMAHVAQVRQPSFQWTVAMAISILQPLSTSDYSLPSRNIDEHQQEKMSSELLVTSPYPSPEHHLDLSSVPETSQQLALALEILRHVTEEYPSQPYSTSFNWQEVVDRLPADFTGTFFPRYNWHCRQILLHSVLFHTSSTCRYHEITLSWLASSRRSKSIGRTTEILVERSPWWINAEEPCNLYLDNMGSCETCRKATDACCGYECHEG
jgi:hypothetical protein